MWSQHSFKCQHSEIWIFWISLTIFYNVVVHFKYSLRFIFGSEHDLMQTVSPKPSNLIIWYFWKLSIYCLIYLFCLDNFEKIIYCLDKKIWQIIRTPNQNRIKTVSLVPNWFQNLGFMNSRGGLPSEIAFQRGTLESKIVHQRVGLNSYTGYYTQ